MLVYAPLRGLRRPAIGAGKYFSVSHRSSIQHGRTTALASSLVALPASLGLLRPVSRTARGLRAPRRRRPSVPALRTALAFGGAVFRRCGRPLGVSSRLQPLRGLQRPATGTGMHFSVSHRPALRLRGVPCLRTSCARHSSPSGLHLFASVCIHSSQSSICIARKLACSSRCSLGSLRPVSFLNSQ